MPRSPLRSIGGLTDEETHWGKPVSRNTMAAAPRMPSSERQREMLRVRCWLKWSGNWSRRRSQRSCRKGSPQVERPPAKMIRSGFRAKTSPRKPTANASTASSRVAWAHDAPAWAASRNGRSVRQTGRQPFFSQPVLSRPENGSPGDVRLNAAAEATTAWGAIGPDRYVTQMPSQTVSSFHDRAIHDYRAPYARPESDEEGGTRTAVPLPREAQHEPSPSHRCQLVREVPGI